LGTLWTKSGTIERDASDVKAGGALAYFYSGGTTTPLTVYQDADETTPHDHPLEAASTGRWPTVFIPFTTSYDLKVTTEAGTQLYYPVEVPNPDPVEAAATSVTDADIFVTGDWKFRTTTGTLTGYVRANGRTIGSAASGASERANADTEDLYTHLWNGHANGILAVSTGRGASAAADFAANKTIALPDCRSASPMGVDDMGNSALSAGYGGTYTTGNATTGGSVGGANTHTLVTGELAAHTHGDGSYASSSDGAHTHSGSTSTLSDVARIPGVGSTVQGTGAVTIYPTSEIAVGAIALTIASDGAHSHDVTGTSGSTGSGTAHNNMPRHVLGTWYIRL